MNDRHDIGGKPSLKEIANMIEAVTWKRPETKPTSDIERRVTIGLLGFCLVFVVCLTVAGRIMDRRLQHNRHRDIITRLDRLTSIAVMDSARVDSLMAAHDYVWISREAR